MPDLVIDGIRVTSTCVNITTGEERPFDEVKEKFFRYALSVMPIVHTDTPVKVSENPEYYVIVNDDGSREVLKKGEKRYREVQGKII